MVHGTNYGTQYVFTLNRVLDYYNDVLPLCIKFRTMFDLTNINNETNTCQLRVLFHANISDRFYKNPEVHDFIHACSTNFEYSKLTKITHELYKHVMCYARFIKHKNVVSFNKQQYAEAVAKLKRLRFSETYDFKLMQDTDIIVTTQNIVTHPAYYQKIIILENKLTNIDLTEAEKTMVNLVKDEPVIQLCLVNAGFDLVAENY